ncbi:hypothetical protein GCM10023186_31880 [Hymenobacter koreensis]|uniref:Uncharacterized protein n=1 Tax=Hymenobacter koreensis TaxID=1084523 RepID=A0ABP8J8E6_9BACT
MRVSVSGTGTNWKQELRRVQAPTGKELVKPHLKFHGYEKVEVRETSACTAARPAPEYHYLGLARTKA